MTCVLAGTETWSRRWARYEIVRSIVRGNGLLTVEIHGIRNSEKQTSARGADPLDQIGIYHTTNGIFFAEWNGGKWTKYADFTLALSVADLWFEPPKTRTVETLSRHFMRYDFASQNGRQNIGGWIELAAELAGN